MAICVEQQLQHSDRCYSLAVFTHGLVELVQQEWLEKFLSTFLTNYLIIAQYSTYSSYRSWPISSSFQTLVTDQQET